MLSPHELPFFWIGDFVLFSDPLRATSFLGLCRVTLLIRPGENAFYPFFILSLGEDSV